MTGILIQPSVKQYPEVLRIYVLHLLFEPRQVTLQCCQILKLIIMLQGMDEFEGGDRESRHNGLRMLVGG